MVIIKYMHIISNYPQSTIKYTVYLCTVLLYLEYYIHTHT